MSEPAGGAARTGAAGRAPLVAPRLSARAPRRAGGDAPGGGLVRRGRLYAGFVALPHTGFALPFALVGAVLASYRYPVRWDHVAWILVAFTAARFAAMAFNRVVDRGYDARNPRTADRDLPAGRISLREARIGVVVAAAIFVLAAGMLNPLCLALSPVALAAILLYSYAKRFTAWTHVFLGLADGIAPAAGWLAIAGEWSEPWSLLPALALAVGAWIGGFDILYSIQDVEVDRRLGLHSIPARFGVRRARLIAGAFHLVTLALLAAVPALLPGPGAGYAAALAVAALLLGLEHGLFDPGSPAAVQRAFFTVNVWLSAAFTALVLADRLW